MHSLTLLSLLLLLLVPAASQAEPTRLTQVNACADEAQWPPFSYADNGALKGFTIDLLERALGRRSIKVRIDQLPWKRCLAATENGQRYQIALDASSSPERQRTFLLTRAYYELTPSFFYSRQHHPNGIQIQRGQELGQFGTVCGLAGYNYSNFALGQTPVYTGAQDFDALIQMTYRGRCALFLGRHEIVAGMARIGRDLLADPELAYAAIPDAQSEPFYMLVSRNIAEPEALQQLLNEAIESMSRSGELDQLRSDYRTPQP